MTGRRESAKKNQNLVQRLTDLVIENKSQKEVFGEILTSVMELDARVAKLEGDVDTLRRSR